MTIIKKESNNIMTTSRFLPLFITQFFYTFNDNTFKNALLIWFTYSIAQKTGQNADLMISVAIGLYILPLFLFSAMAGQLADKFDKSFIARLLMFSEIILMISCVFLFYYASIYGLIALLCLTGLLFALLVPVKYSLLPEHLHANELIKGNGLIEGGTFIATLIGTIFGGLIIDRSNGIFIMGGVLIVAAIIAFVSSLYIPKSPPRDKTSINFNLFTVTKETLQYATKNNQILLIILAISWFWLVALTFLTHFATYTKLIIHGNETLVTFFLTLFSVGIAIGSILCNSLLKGLITTRYVAASSFIISIATFIFCICSYYFSLTIETQIPPLGLSGFFYQSYYSIGIIFSLLTMSMACGLYIIPLYSAMQHLADQRYVARVIAANNVINSLFMGLSSLLAFILVKMGGSIIQVIAIVGVLNLIVVVYLQKSKQLKITITH